MFSHELSPRWRQEVFPTNITTDIFCGYSIFDWKIEEEVAKEEPRKLLCASVIWQLLKMVLLYEYTTFQIFTQLKHTSDANLDMLESEISINFCTKPKSLYKS